MNLYYFNPNSYGQEFFLCAKNKEAAVQALIEWANHPLREDLYRECALDASMEKRGYSIDESPPHTVVRSEIA
tara:strand:+ start:2383 stop:2601 length:219 start_codon:yes stop_codon:yes gene_type:complete